MLLSISRPDRPAIDKFIAAQKDQRFSYSPVGATRDAAPTGYTVDHNRIQLGHGRDDFTRAKVAIQNWKMFDMSWIDLCWPDTSIEVGSTVAVLASLFGLWSLNACRIVYLVAETSPIEKYGFAYGTLPQHGAMGEERFTVEFHAHDQAVWYDLYAFSRPSPLAAVAYPFARSLQRRFARDSKLAMQKAAKQP
jgi:uncharacterized protein (UPF0548 family)